MRLRPLVIIPILLLAALLLWDAPLAASLARPQLAALAPSAFAASPPPGDSITYPRLGISAPLQDSPGTSPLVYADWTRLEDALQHGTLLAYPGSRFAAAPFAFVVGHSSDRYPHPYSSVFAALGQAREGDRFDLRLNGHDYPYVVLDKLTLDPTDTAAFTGLARAVGRPTVALVTCWPPLTTRERLVVIAEQDPAAPGDGLTR